MGDIINRVDSTQRKLPMPLPMVPRVAVHDLLNGDVASGSSSSNNSVAGDLSDRI